MRGDDFIAVRKRELIRIGKTSKRTMEQVLDRAAIFFGPSGLGLRLDSRSPDSIRLEGGGGHVVVTVKPDGKRTDVDVVSIEWDHHAKRFLTPI